MTYKAYAASGSESSETVAEVGWTVFEFVCVFLKFQLIHLDSVLCFAQKGDIMY